ncbi:carbohydrate ABC transporter membrane protein 1, CUT1 family [Rhizobiales bacterium GAS191]|nr:carbohydrate ABC transporter membrane protein 1, CUT1 family [Rhizobiales bacterium GAS191]
MREAAQSQPAGRGFRALLVWMALAYLIAFSAFPLIYNIVISFQEIDLFSLADLRRPFVGLANYKALFARPEFWPIAWNTVLFVVLSIVFQVTIGFLLAAFFLQDFPGAGYIRGLFLAGWIVPGLVVGAIWKWILAGDFGVLNYVLAAIHLISGKIFWLSDPKIALFAVTLVNIWLGVPFNMLLLSVGLAAIPAEVYEAAAIDGAGPVTRLLKITLPLMRASIGAVVSLGIIFTLHQFDLIAALTQGGPSDASNVAQFWSWQLSFQTYEIGQGSTISVLMILLVVIVALIYVRSTRHEYAA